MTREEAIKGLKSLVEVRRKFGDMQTMKDEIECLDMAIKALEQEPKYCDRNICIRNDYNGIGCGECEVTKSQEPCDYAISRQAMFDGLVNIAKAKAKSDAQKSLMGRVMFFTEQLPPVNPQPKTGYWIPISERLPEDQEVVLVSTKTDRVFEGRYYDDNTKRQWYSFRDDTFAWNNVVTAWMPLPEPYKAESEDKE